LGSCHALELLSNLNPYHSHQNTHHHAHQTLQTIQKQTERVAK
jgi:hypothetical protein